MPLAMLHIAKSNSTAYSTTRTNAQTVTDAANGLIIENTNIGAGGFSVLTFEGHPYDGPTYDYAQIGAVWTSDGNSELYFKTEDSGDVREVMRITDTGKVGIGATAPGGFLSVEGAGNSRGIFVKAAGATSYSAIQAEADALTTGSVGLFLSNSANTSTRSLVKIVNDHVSATGTTPLKVTQDAPTWSANIQNTNAVGYGLSIDTSADTGSAVNKLACYTLTNSGMFLTNQGRVGIGTDTPTTILEVATSANSSDGTFSSWSTSDAHSGTIIFKKSGSNTIGTYLETADGERLGTIAVYGSTSGNTLSQATASIYFQQDGAATGSRVPSRITFLTSPSANNMAEVMRINSVGNVGIGTTTPIAKLQVSGRIGAGELGNSQITRNGLNLYVDFSDKACVSGTSSSEVPLDLGPNNYSMTLFNQTFFEYKDGIGTYRFDGSGDAIKIANFVVAGNANSYEFWFYANAQDSWETLWDSGSERPLLGTWNSQLRAYPDATSHATISTGRWYHVVWAFASNSDYDVFVNGARVTEADNYAATQRTGTFEAWIGEAIGTEAFNGWVSIVRAYSRQLTPADVLQNYNAEVGTFATVTPELGIVQSGGNVGIGNAEPVATLEVRAASPKLLVSNSTWMASGTSTTESQLGFKVNNSDDDERIKGAIIFKNQANDYGVGDLLFCFEATSDNANVTSANEKVRFQSDGKRGYRNNFSPDAVLFMYKADYLSTVESISYRVIFILYNWIMADNLEYIVTLIAATFHRRY